MKTRKYQIPSTRSHNPGLLSLLILTLLRGPHYYSRFLIEKQRLKRVKDLLMVILLVRG